MGMFRQLIQKAINAVGYDVYRRTVGSNPGLQLARSLDNFDIDIVVDVGANTGQFAQQLRRSGYDGRIVSIEPLSLAYEKLLASARRDIKWDIYKRCAVGDHDGEISINISGNSVSSSILPMKKAHVSAAAQSAYIGVETVRLLKLDTILPHYFDGNSKIFLKLDAQGYEWEVLNGASESLSQVHGVLCELSLVPLYDGQRLWLEILDRLAHAGFHLWSLNKGFTDLRTGRALQVDATWYKA